LGWILLITLFQFLANPIWIATQIRDWEHLSFIAVLAVINAKWETARQHPMKPKMKR
jgi:hypothetical protein